MAEANQWIAVADKFRPNASASSDATRFLFYRVRLQRSQEVSAYCLANGKLLGQLNLQPQQESILFASKPPGPGFRAVTFRAPRPGQTLSNAADLLRHPDSLLCYFALPLQNFALGGWYVFNGPNPIPPL